MIRVKLSNLAEKAYATTGVRQLRSGDKLLLQHPVDPNSLRVPFSPPIEIVNTALSTTASTLYDLFRGFGRIRYVGSMPSIIRSTATSASSNLNELDCNFARPTGLSFVLQFYRPDSALTAITAYASYTPVRSFTVRELAAVPLSSTLSNPYYSFAPFLPKLINAETGEEYEGPKCGASQEAKCNLDTVKLLSAVGALEPLKAVQIVKLLSGVRSSHFQTFAPRTE